MNILVTGAKGFVGRNLCAELKNIRDGKAKTYKVESNLDIMEYDVDTDVSLLDDYCRNFFHGIKVCRSFVGIKIQTNQ